ncbi:MAG: polysaccharide lyase family 7 protein [Myxococcales bacterium]|nr:polysaccharide lyase family 7 protein [Myxococcales bacterium]
MEGLHTHTHPSTTASQPPTQVSTSPVDSGLFIEGTETETETKTVEEPCGVTAADFSADNWVLTLPVDADGALTGTAREVYPPELASHDDEWFYEDTEQIDEQACATLHLSCPDGGATRPGESRAQTALVHQRAFDWDAATEMTLVFSTPPVEGTEGEKVNLAILDPTEGRPELKIVYTAQRRLLRILYVPRVGDEHDAVGILLDEDVAEGDPIPMRIRRSPSELQVFLLDNVDGAEPDWSSNDADNTLSSDAPKGSPTDFLRTNSAPYAWAVGNYYQVVEPVLGKDGKPLQTPEGELVFDGDPRMELVLHEGTWSAPADVTAR